MTSVLAKVEGSISLVIHLRFTLSVRHFSTCLFSVFSFSCTSRKVTISFSFWLPGKHNWKRSEKGSLSLGALLLEHVSIPPDFFFSMTFIFAFINGLLYSSFLGSWTTETERESNSSSSWYSLEQLLWFLVRAKSPSKSSALEWVKIVARFPHRLAPPWLSRLVRGGV